MSRLPRFSPDDIRVVVRHVFHTDADSVSHLPVGWGNENWRTSVRGGKYLIKIGPPGSADKWAATAEAYRLAREAGVPVPDVLHFDAASDLVDGCVLRVLAWVEGLPPERVLHDVPITETFFGDLARALRLLHSIPTPTGFTSRLDGSAPQFSQWSDYIAWRLPRVLERVRTTTAFREEETETVVAEIEQLAVRVDAVARPAICHRDVYLDNVLATEDGHVAALLDFDGAEAWDPAVDLVKLRWLVFPRYRSSELAFTNAYCKEAMWGERIRLAELLELLNAVPNAVMSGNRDFETSARTRLKLVLTG